MTKHKDINDITVGVLEMMYDYQHMSVELSNGKIKGFRVEEDEENGSK